MFSEQELVSVGDLQGTEKQMKKYVLDRELLEVVSSVQNSR